MQKDAKGWLFSTKPLGFGYGHALRLTKKIEFDRVFRQAKVRRSQPPLRLLALPNAMTTPRLGIVVGKRAVRRAVDRNRVKRAIRESFRNEQQRLPSMDIIVQAMPARGMENYFNALGNALPQLWKGLESEA